MPLLVVALPLSAQDLVALGQAGYSLVDQAARTPGLLIAQAPDQPAPAPAPAPAPGGLSAQHASAPQEPAAAEVAL